MENLKENKRILLLFTNAGGGHRSAAEAIIEALETLFGKNIGIDIVDIFKEYAPPPFNYLPDSYPTMVRIPQAWEAGFRLTNGSRRTRAILSSSWPYVHKSIKKMLSEHPCDLIVSVHPIGVAATLKFLGKNHIPFVTVVTDLVTTHAFWYHKYSNLCIVPTELARQRALSYGINPEQIQVVGLPVSKKFSQPVRDKNELKMMLGLPVDQLTVLLVGGGEGMGPLEHTAVAIDEEKLPLTLIIITGRNEKLKNKLESYKWTSPTQIWGFVDNMPDFMGAADILLTKAGPGTISEALNIGLPMILYNKLPGQEEGNVEYITSEGAGIWAPTTKKVIQALNYWIENPELRQQAAKQCQQIARPNAAIDIAKILGKMLNLTPFDQ